MDGCCYRRRRGVRRGVGGGRKKEKEGNEKTNNARAGADTADAVQSGLESFFYLTHVHWGTMKAVVVHNDQKKN